VLGFGNDCRLNTPGTPTGNWQWRCAARFFTDETAAWLRDLSTLFGRIPPTPQPKPVHHEDPAH
jgi:4-alpha-glucanotransferase